MTDASPTVMDRLKGGTQDLHDSAEAHAHQAALVKGELPLETYVEHLKQHYVLHKALEAKLREVRASHPAFEAVVHEEQYQEPYLLEDFAHFGVDPATIEPLPETTEVVNQIEAGVAQDPLKALGYHYVLEGSNNGNRFIAMKLAQVYNLTEGKGLKYLDPYGQSQREKWMAFRAAMIEQDFTEQQIESMLAAAREMFAGISTISDGLAKPATA